MHIPSGQKIIFQGLCHVHISVKTIQEKLKQNIQKVLKKEAKTLGQRSNICTDAYQHLLTVRMRERGREHMT